MNNLNISSRLIQLIPKIKELRNAATKISETLPDETALENIALYPTFKSGLVVKIGERYKDSTGNLYRVVQAHTTQNDWQPSTTPALWAKVSIESWPQWVQPTGAHDVYNLGDKVTFNGQHYISTINNNSWSPIDYPAGWTLS